MPTAPDYTDPIARLEAATGPDRELDRRIYCAVHDGFDVIEGVVMAIMGGFRATVRDDLVPHYTASIDAALTLVPEGMGFGVKRQFGRLFAWVDRDIAPAGNIAVREAGTLPIALCIAALKARMNGGA